VHDIYVRAHTRSLEPQESKVRPEHQKEPKWSDHALIFDCETRLSADQTLTFGFWRFCELRNGTYVAVEEGMFHDTTLSAAELKRLRKYARNTKPDTVADGSDRLHLFPLPTFIHEVLGIGIQAKALIVGFNLGFDLSRIALDWETAKNGGWSLIFSQWFDRRTKEVNPNKFFPRIVVKSLNSKTAIIHSTRAPMSEPSKKTNKARLWPTARFLDLRTLLWALRNRSYSLKAACVEFKTKHQKIDHAPTGKVTIDEINYARQDVACTLDLLNAAKQEFDLHPIEPGPDRMFSPASVAKGYIDKLNVLYPSGKVTHG
jgi:hypothetical protein